MKKSNKCWSWQHSSTVLGCHSLSDIDQVLAAGGVVDSWGTAFQNRAKHLLAQRRQTCPALKNLLLYETFFEHGTFLTGLEEIEALPPGELQLLGQDQLLATVNSTLEVLRNLPSANRTALLHAARRELCAEHGFTNSQLSTPADVVQHCKSALSQRVLQGCLYDLFETLSSSIKSF